MIHTLEFTITDIPLNVLNAKFKPTKDIEKNKDILIKRYTLQTNAITFNLYSKLIIQDSRLTNINSRKILKTKDLNTLKIIVNPSKLLNKNKIIDTDYSEFKKRFEEECYYRLNIKLNIDNIELSRIDYKYDFYTEYEYKALYVHLLSKTAPCGRLKINNKSNTYYSSNAYNINLYDKEKERIDKVEDAEGLENLLRLEIQLKDIIKTEFKNYGVIPILQNYWSNGDWNYYLNYLLNKIIYAGNYYNLYYAKKIINANNKISNTIKNNLIEFLKYISVNGVIKAKKQYKSSFSNYINYLNMLNVNPILIPKNNKFKITNLDNIFNFNYTDNTYLLDNYSVIKEKYIKQVA